MLQCFSVFLIPLPCLQGFNDLSKSLLTGHCGRSPEVLVSYVAILFTNTVLLVWFALFRQFLLVVSAGCCLMERLLCFSLLPNMASSNSALCVSDHVILKIPQCTIVFPQLNFSPHEWHTLLMWPLCVCVPLPGHK